MSEETREKPDSTIEQLQPKKRNRITVVCNICKARKVKCDRKSPCTLCVKHSSMHLCTYNEEKPKRRKRKAGEMDHIENPPVAYPQTYPPQYPYQYYPPYPPQPQQPHRQSHPPHQQVQSQPPQHQQYAAYPVMMVPPTFSPGYSVRNVAGLPEPYVSPKEQSIPYRSYDDGMKNSPGRMGYHPYPQYLYGPGPGSAPTGPIIPIMGSRTSSSGSIPVNLNGNLNGNLPGNLRPLNPNINPNRSDLVSAAGSPSAPTLNTSGNPSTPRETSLPGHMITTPSSVSLPPFQTLSRIDFPLLPAKPNASGTYLAKYTSTSIPISPFTPQSLGEGSIKQETNLPMKFTPSPKSHVEKSENEKIKMQAITILMPNQEISPPDLEDGTKQNGTTPAAPTTQYVSELAAYLPVKVSRPPTPDNVRAVLALFRKFEDVLGVNPVLEENVTSDIFWNYPSIEILEDEETPGVSDINHGPFSVFAMMKKDVGLSDVWSFVKLKQKERKENSKAVEEKLSSEEPVKSSEDETEEIDMFIDVSKEILEILPPRKFVWLHIKRYFRLIYPFYPFLDETYFFSKMEALLGEGDEETVPTKIHLKTREEYANVGILLVLLNLSYQALHTLSKETNDYYKNFDPKTDDLESPLNSRNLSVAQIETLSMLMKQPIHPKSISIVKNIIIRLQPLFNTSKVNLTILQFLSLMRVYYSLATNDYDDPSETVKYHAFDAQLFQSAYHIGLNKEPDSFKQILEDPKVNNLRRKLWRYLKIHDLSTIKYNGRQSSLLTAVDTTRSPYFEAGNENLKFNKLERFTHDSITQLDSLYDGIREILELVLKSPKINLSILASKLSDVELTISKDVCVDFSKMLDMVNNFTIEDKINYVMQVHYYIGARLFLFGNYYHLFMYYENLNDMNLTFFYLKKLLVLMIGEFMPNYEKLMKLDHFFFGNGLNLVLNPAIILLLKKANYYLFGILTRLSYTMQTLIRGDNDVSVHKENMATDEEYKAYFGKITKFSLLVTKAIKINLWHLLQFGEYYAYARTSCSLHAYLLNSVFCEDFYNAATFYLFCKTYTGEMQCHITHKEAYDLTRLERLCDFKFSGPQLDDLIDVVDTAINSVSLKQFTEEQLKKQLSAVITKEIHENPTSINKYFTKPSEELSDTEKVIADYGRTWASPFTLEPEENKFFPMEFPSFKQNLNSLFGSGKMVK